MRRSNTSLCAASFQAEENRGSVSVRIRAACLTNVLLHRLKVRSRKRLEVVLARSPLDEVTPSGGEVNHLIKGPFREVSPAVDRADGYLP
jgi:hypothetical protein